MTTMNEMYGDGSDHEVCDECGFCITCGDCNNMDMVMMTTKNCLVCSNEFEVYDKNRRGRKGTGVSRKYKRGINTVNCSKKCPFIYAGMSRSKQNQLKKIHKERFNKQ